MIVKVLNESGYNESLLGLSLSYYDHAEPLEKWWDDDKKARAKKRAEALAFKGGGHNKYLASIFVWAVVHAPRCWFSEYDTYKISTTANSSSTMHTLSKRNVTIDDFEEGICLSSISAFNTCIDDYHNKDSIYYHDVTRLKMNLPESFLQERQICINYMTIQNIIKQRRGHRLKQWDIFIDSLLSQLEHPELLYHV